MRHTVLPLLLALFLASVPALAQTEVGEVSFANSGSPAAQETFLRGLALLHNFEYPDAAAEFHKAQAIDPGFAMAYWGEAMTYTHPVWMQQDRDAARAALERIGQPADARAERLAPAEFARLAELLGDDRLAQIGRAHV